MSWPQGEVRYYHLSAQGDTRCHCSGHKTSAPNFSSPIPTCSLLSILNSAVISNVISNVISCLIFHFTTLLMVMVGTWAWNTWNLVKEALKGSQPSASWNFLQKMLIKGRCASVVEGDYGKHYRWHNLISFELVSGNLNNFIKKCYIDLYSWYFIYELDIFQILNDLYHQAPAVTCISRAHARHRKYMQNQIFLTQGWQTNTNPSSLK